MKLMLSSWVRLTRQKATWTQGRSDGIEIGSCATDCEATGATDYNSTTIKTGE
jgi:hypothetical protein